MDLGDAIDWFWIAVQAMPIVIATASAIAALTPTPRDDRAVKKWSVRLYQVIDWLALNTGHAKETGELR